MRRFSFLAWLVLPPVTSALGWILGGLFGSYLPRTVLATIGAAIALDLLSRNGRIVWTCVAVALASLAAFLFGLRVVTPLLAWPVAALAMGVSASFTLTRRWAKIASVAIAPVLGVAGFVLGISVIVFLGFARDDNVLLGQFLLGGSAGFGLFTVLGLAMIRRWLDHTPVREEVEV